MPQFTSAQSLLSLPGELLRPNPYQVFGLRGGESDEEAIAAAIRATIRRLNDSKSSSDPAAWKQAAAWVTAARDQLKDPAAKQRLDEALQSAGSAVRPTPPATPRRAADPADPADPAAAPKVAAPDPLAGLLPPDDSPSLAALPSALEIQTKPRLFAGRAVLPPSASSLSPTSPRLANPPPTPLPPQPIGAVPDFLPELSATAPASPRTPEFLEWEPGATPTPMTSPGAAASAASPTSDLAGLLVTPNASPERRPAAARRRTSTFPWANAFLFLFAIACLAAVGGLIYTVSNNPQGLVISLQTGGASGNSVPAAGPATVGAPDPVMTRPGQANGGESVGRGRPVRPRAASTRASTDQLNEADRWLQGLTESGGESPPMNGDQPQAPAAGPTPAVPMADAPMSAVPTADATPLPDTPTPDTPPSDTPLPNPVPATSEPGATEPMATTPGDAPSTDLIEAGEAALKRARDAVAKGEWSTMVELVEAAAAAAVTEPQKRSAAQLGELADLATYYHGAIEKGVAGLRAGETFNLTEQLQIAVVEVAPEKLIVRFNGKNKEYPRGELPLVMAHKMARFSLPTESPVTQIAAEVYQTLAPVSSAQYRQQSLRKLEAMPEMVDDIRPADLVAAIRELDFE